MKRNNNEYFNCMIPDFLIFYLNVYFNSFVIHNKILAINPKDEIKCIRKKSDSTSFYLKCFTLLFPRVNKQFYFVLSIFFPINIIQADITIVLARITYHSYHGAKKLTILLFIDSCMS